MATPLHHQKVRTVANYSNEEGYSILILRFGEWTHYFPGMAVSEDEMNQIESIREEAREIDAALDGSL